MFVLTDSYAVVWKSYYKVNPTRSILKMKYLNKLILKSQFSYFYVSNGHINRYTDLAL